MNIFFSFFQSVSAHTGRVFRQIRGLFPEALPNGMVAFEQWSQDLVNTYPMPTQDIDSIRFVLSTVIMHLGPKDAYKSKFYFYITLKAGAAKQVAAATFQEIKIRQEAQAKAAALAKSAEATALSMAVANVPTTQD